MEDTFPIRSTDNQADTVPVVETVPAVKIVPEVGIVSSVQIIQEVDTVPKIETVPVVEIGPSVETVPTVEAPLPFVDSTNEPELTKNNEKSLNMSAGAVKLRSWLNKSFKVEMTDGRILIGIFLCTDRDSNIILGSCSEYLPADKTKSPNEEPRMLGLVMIPGKHIVSLSIDPSEYRSGMKKPFVKDERAEETM